MEINIIRNNKNRLDIDRYIFKSELITWCFRELDIFKRIEVAAPCNYSELRVSFGIRNTYSRSISAEIWVMLLENTTCKEHKD